MGGGTFLSGGGQSGGAHAPPHSNICPPPKTTMFFSVCVGEIDVKKWGGNLGGGGVLKKNLGGGK